MIPDGGCGVMVGGILLLLIVVVFIVVFILNFVLEGRGGGGGGGWEGKESFDLDQLIALDDLQSLLIGICEVSRK